MAVCRIRGPVALPQPRHRHVWASKPTIFSCVAKCSTNSVNFTSAIQILTSLQCSSLQQHEVVMRYFSAYSALLLATRTLHDHYMSFILYMNSLSTEMHAPQHGYPFRFSRHFITYLFGMLATRLRIQNVLPTIFNNILCLCLP